MKQLIIPSIALLYVASSLSAETTIDLTGTDRIYNTYPATTILNDGPYVLGLNVGDAVNGAVVKTGEDKFLNFKAGTITGTKNSITYNNITLTVGGNGSFYTGGTTSYSKNTALGVLFESGSSTPSENGLITLELSRLTTGYEYRLQLLNFVPEVNPNAREMILSNADNSSNNSDVYSYYNLKSGSALNAVRMDAVWTADSTSQSFNLDADAGFNRATLQGVALHITAIP
jgi:hypothetical protein